MSENLFIFINEQYPTVSLLHSAAYNIWFTKTGRHSVSLHTI